MNFKEYVDGCKRTEALEPIAVDGRMIGAMRCCAAVADVLDVLKKITFYGQKTDKHSTLLDSTYAVLAGRVRDEILDLECGDVSRLKDVPFRFFHGVIGIATEAGEMVQGLLASLKSGKIDRTNIKEELGDILWFFAIICDVFGFSIEKIMESNNAKLRQRYPEKFTVECTTNRDVDAEREVLEASAMIQHRTIRPYTRASQHATCPCGKIYGRHPQDQIEPWLNVLCDGSLVKL